MVTGVGLVSPLGIGTQANWEALSPGKSGIGPITRFDASQYSARIAGEVKGFDPLQFVDKKDVKKMDVFIQFALAASQFAVDDARLEVTPEIADSRRRLHRVGHRRLPAPSSASTSSCIEGRPAPHLAVLHSRRRSSTSPPARSRSASTRAGRTSPPAPPARRRRTPSARPTRSSAAATPTSMIAGGSEAAITPMGVGGFAAMRALSTRNDDPQRASRPFDKDRDGFVMGEGAGICILETLELGAPPRRADLRRARRLRPDLATPTTSPASPKTAHGAVRVDDDGAAQGGRRARRRSTTSTRTAPRRRSTIRPRRSASRRCSASTPTSWRCRRPSR